MLLDDKLKLISAIAYAKGYYRTPKGQEPKPGEIRGMELLNEAAEIVHRQRVEYVPSLPTAGSTVHDAGCECGFCRMGVTKL